MTELKFYRYDSVEYASLDFDGDAIVPPFPNPTIELRTFDLFKETSKGYWIISSGLKFFSRYKKWVSKTAKKRYAYPSKKEALNSFIKRNQRRLEILERQLELCKANLAKAELIKTDDN